MVILEEKHDEWGQERMVEENLESGSVDYCIDRLSYKRVCRNGMLARGLCGVKRVLFLF